MSGSAGASGGNAGAGGDAGASGSTGATGGSGGTNVEGGAGASTGGSAGSAAGGGGVAGQDSAAPKPDGDACSATAECASGYCVDGVCCESACTGSCMACAATLHGQGDGHCATVLSGLDPHDDCASGEGLCTTGTCDASGACALIPDGQTCRTVQGPCDIEETCSAGACPADSVWASGADHQCRASAGICDLAELCDGISAQCPADALEASGSSCRPPLDVCDVGEQCDGVSADCPTDGFASAATVCRTGTDLCDADERCSGSDAACPVDALAPAGTTCRGAAAACDKVEICSGTLASCPSDAVAPAGSPCGAYACTGTSLACPTSCESSVDCSSGSSCINSRCGKRAFITSTTTTGALGGLAGADAFCQALATARSLPGTYRAWLSDSTASAASRLVHVTVPYLLVDGTKLVDDWNDLVDGTLDANFNLDETGLHVASNVPYTGTTASGSAGVGNCLDWSTAASSSTGLSGYSETTDSAWTTNGYYGGCNVLHRLFCLQQ